MIITLIGEYPKAALAALINECVNKCIELDPVSRSKLDFDMLS